MSDKGSGEVREDESEHVAKERGARIARAECGQATRHLAAHVGLTSICWVGGFWRTDIPDVSTRVRVWQMRCGVGSAGWAVCDRLCGVGRAGWTKREVNAYEGSCEREEAIASGHGEAGEGVHWCVHRGASEWMWVCEEGRMHVSKEGRAHAKGGTNACEDMGSSAH